MNVPTLRQLEYVVAVARTRHFGRAAQACHVTQPALSAQVKLVEEQLGAPLFERGRRAVVVTAAGERLLPLAQRLLADAEALVAAARGSRGLLTGTLRLGAIPTVAPFLLPKVLPAIRKRFPRLRLLLREDKTHELVAQLQAAELDAAILALPLRAKGLSTIDIGDDRLLVALPKGHRMAARRVLREGDLHGEEVLLLEEGHCLRDQALDICRVAGAPESPDFRGTSLTTLVQVVAGGVGVTLVPAIAASAGVVPRESVVLVPLQGPRSSRRLVLAFRAADPHAGEHGLLARALAEAAVGALAVRR